MADTGISQWIIQGVYATKPTRITYTELNALLPFKENQESKNYNCYFLKDFFLIRIFETDLMLKLKLQYFGHLMAKNWLIWKDPDAGKDWRQEEKGTTEDEMVGWHHWLEGRTWVGVSSRSWRWTGKPGVQQSIGSQRAGHHWATELNWTELKQTHPLCSKLLFRRKSY